MEEFSQEKFETTVAKLRKVEFQQKAILNNIPDMTWLKDLDGRFIAVNETFAKACGFKIEEIIGKTDLDIWPKELALCYRADDQEVINSKKRKCVQEKLIYHEGEEQWIETIKTPFFDDHNHVLGTTGIARNITLRKNESDRLEEIRAELELRVKVRTTELASFNDALRKEMRVSQLAQKELTSQGNFFHNVFNSIQDGVCVLDLQMNILMINETMEKWYPYSLPLVGKKCYQAYHQRDKPCESCPVKETLKTHKPACFDSPLEDKDKKIIGWFDLFSFPLFNKNSKELIGVIEYVRDISEVKRNEIEKEKSLSLLEATLEATLDGILVVDLKGKVIKANQKFYKLWRIPEHLISTKEDDLLLEFVLEQLTDPKEFILEVRRLYDCPEEGSMDTLIFKDGRIFERFSVPQKIDQKIVGRVWSFRDVTDNKNYENELKVYREKLEILVEKRTQELEHEILTRKEAQAKAVNLQQQMEFVLGTTRTGFDIIDRNYNLRYVDPMWARNYGDWQGKKCYDYFMSRQNPCSNCGVEEAFKTKKIVVRDEILVKENNRSVMITTIPYQDKDGDWLVAEVNVDITERKKIDEELKIYRNDLEQLVIDRTRDLLEETNRYKASELEKTKLNRELLKINEKLKSSSLIDSHTGLYNYRYLQQAVEVEFHQARRYAQNLTVIMLDVDYFKSINDVYGIAFGDLVLKQIARQLKRLVRRYDLLIRYSGEEFIVISPRLSRNAGFIMAQRLLSSLNFINFGNKKQKVKLKLSLSVASFPEDKAKNGMDLVNLADRLLNKVKESGGNRAYSTLDIKHPLSKGIEKVSKFVGIKTLKNTINKLNKQSKQGLSESIFAFAKTLELKDHYTGEHVENTVFFATGLARELNLSSEEVELIKQAAMLHDLGKIGISENILLKKGKLSKKEFEEIKKHPQIGADIIRPIQFLHDLIPFIFYHHEHWDGKGYPTGIKGEDIPLGARVIAIADVYQALTSDRPYHKAFAKKTAIDIIKKASGTQFDPRIVSAFLRVVRKEK